MFEITLGLDGEKEYQAGTTEYPFELTVPQMDKLIEKGESGRLLGAVEGAFEWLTDPVTNLPWYLDASLNLPMSLDISKRILIKLER